MYESYAEAYMDIVDCDRRFHNIEMSVNDDGFYGIFVLIDPLNRFTLRCRVVANPTEPYFVESWYCPDEANLDPMKPKGRFQKKIPFQTVNDMVKAIRAITYTNNPCSEIPPPSGTI